MPFGGTLKIPDKVQAGGAKGAMAGGGAGANKATKRGKSRPQTVVNTIMKRALL